MTTKQAIRLLHRLQDEQFDGIHGDERREALSMAVRALEQNLVKESGGLVKDLVKDCISRKMAIDEVKRLHDVAWANWKETRISANTMIDALKDLPSAQPEVAKDTNVPNNDCISRQMAIEAFEPTHYTDWYTPTIIKTLEELPSAQPERKKGKWIILPPIFEEICQCSNCKMKFKDALQWTNYCPNCRADMRGESDE